jgi:hypothetical protein
MEMGTNKVKGAFNVKPAFPPALIPTCFLARKIAAGVSLALPFKPQQFNRQTVEK